MKLEFLKKPMEYLRPVLREVRMVEETSEAIIPDSCPDVQNVIGTTGMAFLRGKDLSEGMLAISTGVSAMALCQPEGRDVPEVVEVYIPMSLKLENSQLHMGQVLRAEAHLRRLDGHLVNPRKVMVRATVAICVWVYEPVREEHADQCASAGLQMLKKTAALRCLKTMGEKNYTVEDSARFSPEGIGETLLGCEIDLRHTDARLTGTRAVLKGEGNIRVLYLDPQGKAACGTAQIPFSQYVDLGECSETDELMLQSVLTGADVALSSDGGGLNVTLQICTTAQAWGKTELEYLEDMYSLSGKVVPERAERSYDSLVDRQIFAPTAHSALDGIMGRGLFVSCIPGEVTAQRSGETVSLTLPVTVQVIFEDETGRLQGTASRVELNAATQASENCRFEAAGEDISTSFSGGGSMSLKVTGNLHVDTFGSFGLWEIMGGELEEETVEKGGPGLIIRRPGKGETLWDMAKNHRTTPEAISRANGLSGEPVPDKMLLIPKCH